MLCLNKNIPVLQLKGKKGSALSFKTVDPSLCKRTTVCQSRALLFVPALADY